MGNDYDVVDVEPVILAVTAETEIGVDEIATAIGAMFDVVYQWLPEAPVSQAGHNYAIYRNTTEGTFMRVGFPVSERFTSSGKVECLEFPPASEAAHATHQGDYSGIPATYDRLHDWARRQQLSLTGLNWEVYGDWSDNPLELVTDIFLQIG